MSGAAVESIHLTEAESDALACRCHAGICPLHNEASDGYVEHEVTDLLAAVESLVSRRLRSVVGDLIPGLRTEAERLRGIGVISVALWMEAEADRLEHVTTPTQAAPR